MTKEIADIAEGYFNRNNYLDSIYNSKLKNAINLPNIFQRWVVLETIFDPTIINDSKILELEDKFGSIRNSKYAKLTSLPRNSILAKPVFNSRLGNKTTSDINIMFLYPMFPSALSMPCKPGEHVWVMFESLTEIQNLGYWICSIVGPGHMDDVNHSHPPRNFERTFLSLEDGADAGSTHQELIKKPRYHFKNGVYKQVLEGEDSVVSPETSIISGDEDEYVRILSSSEAAYLSTYESVPRFKKRPGDIVLEGSNNALISIGRDRIGAITNYTTSDENGNKTVPQPQSGLSIGNFDLKNAGAIDLVTGRGQKPETSGKKVINHLQNEELAKDKPSTIEIPNEGDPDFINDRSRIYISQRTKVDQSLLVSQRNISRTPPVSDSENGDAGIIIKSDKVRIFARSDVQILVSGFAEEQINFKEADYEPGLTNSGDEMLESPKIKTENKDSKKWASITIKSNGDIVFEPSDTGYIKLGGEDANRGIVCTTQPVVASNGGVAGAPLLTTDGGQLAGSVSPTPTGNAPALPQDQSLDLGTYSNKVLIK